MVYHSRSRRQKLSLPLGNADQVVPGVPRTRYSRGLIEQTKAVWQPYYDEVLTDEDAREIIEHMVNLVRDLAVCRSAMRTRASDRAGDGAGKG